MDDRPGRTGNARPAVAALLIVLFAAAPALLFGEPFTPVGLVAIGAGLLGVGLLLRVAGSGEWRRLGSILVVIGIVAIIVGSAVWILVLGGWGRPY